jgi:hypothetical protein
MPHTYLPDVKKILDDLSTDDGLTLEGRLILLAMITDYITELTKTLEDGLARNTGDQSH